MEKTTKNTKEVQHMALAIQEPGVWLPPEMAAPFFRNGKGIKLPALMYNLRIGKLDDIAFKDAFGWHIFIPQHMLEQKDIKSFNAA